ncbi:MAG: hypothetical protein DRO89_03190, partial [Candidatus Altiarchaeales archaeon]
MFAMREIRRYKRSVKRNIRYRDNLKTASEFFHCLGRAYQKGGNCKDAINSYRMAIQLNPENYRAYIGLGDILYELGDVNGAIRSFRKAIKLNPREAKFYIALSRALKEIGDLDGAINAYNRAIELNPEINGNGKLRRELERDVKNSREVERDERKSLYDIDGGADRERFPDQPIYDREVLKDLKGLRKLMIRAIEKLIEKGLVEDIVQDVSHIHICFEYEWGDNYMKGWKEMLKRKRGTFLFHLYELDELNPNAENRNVRIDFNKKTVSEPEILHIRDSAGELLEAVPPGEIGLAEPEGFTAYITYGNKYFLNKQRFDIVWAESYFADRRQIEKIEKFKRDIERNPEDSRLYYKLGRIHHEINAYTDAIRYLEKAIELDPENPEFHFSLGNVLFDEGDYRGAIKNYEKALRLLEESVKKAEEKPVLSLSDDVTLVNMKHMADIRLKIHDAIVSQRSSATGRLKEIVGEARADYGRVIERGEGRELRVLERAREEYDRLLEKYLGRNFRQMSAEQIERMILREPMPKAKRERVHKVIRDALIKRNICDIELAMIANGRPMTTSEILEFARRVDHNLADPRSNKLFVDSFVIASEMLLGSAVLGYNALKGINLKDAAAKVYISSRALYEGRIKGKPEEPIRKIGTEIPPGDVWRHRERAIKNANKELNTELEAKLAERRYGKDIREIIEAGREAGLDEATIERIRRNYYRELLEGGEGTDWELMRDYVGEVTPTEDQIVEFMRKEGYSDVEIARSFEYIRRSYERAEDVSVERREKISEFKRAARRYVDNFDEEFNREIRKRLDEGKHINEAIDEAILEFKGRKEIIEEIDRRLKTAKGGERRILKADKKLLKVGVVERLKKRFGVPRTTKVSIPTTRKGREVRFPVRRELKQLGKLRGLEVNGEKISEEEIRKAAQFLRDMRIGVREELRDLRKVGREFKETRKAFNYEGIRREFERAISESGIRLSEEERNAVIEKLTRERVSREIREALNDLGVRSEVLRDTRENRRRLRRDIEKGRKPKYEVFVDEEALRKTLRERGLTDEQIEGEIAKREVLARELNRFFRNYEGTLTKLSRRGGPVKNRILRRILRDEADAFRLWRSQPDAIRKFLANPAAGFEVPTGVGKTSVVSPSSDIISHKLFGTKSTRFTQLSNESAVNRAYEANRIIYEKFGLKLDRIRSIYEERNPEVLLDRIKKADVVYFERSFGPFSYLSAEEGLPQYRETYAKIYEAVSSDIHLSIDEMHELFGNIGYIVSVEGIGKVPIGREFFAAGEIFDEFIMEYNARKGWSIYEEGKNIEIQTKGKTPIKPIYKEEIRREFLEWLKKKDFEYFRERGLITDKESFNEFRSELNKGFAEFYKSRNLRSRFLRDAMNQRARVLAKQVQGKDFGSIEGVKGAKPYVNFEGQENMQFSVAGMAVAVEIVNARLENPHALKPYKLGEHMSISSGSLMTTQARYINDIRLKGGTITGYTGTLSGVKRAAELSFGIEVETIENVWEPYIKKRLFGTREKIDLKEKNVPRRLRKIFEEMGRPLSENAIIEEVEGGWRIIDRESRIDDKFKKGYIRRIDKENYYFIEKKGEELIVYETSKKTPLTQEELRAIKDVKEAFKLREGEEIPTGIVGVWVTEAPHEAELLEHSREVAQKLRKRLILEKVSGERGKGTYMVYDREGNVLYEIKSTEIDKLNKLLAGEEVTIEVDGRKITLEGTKENFLVLSRKSATAFDVKVPEGYEFWDVLDVKTPEHRAIQGFGRDRGIWNGKEYGFGHKRKTWIIGAEEGITVDQLIKMLRENETLFSKNANFDAIIKSLEHAGKKPFANMRDLATNERLREILKKELIEYSKEINLDDWMGESKPETPEEVINRNLDRISRYLERRSSELLADEEFMELVRKDPRGGEILKILEETRGVRSRLMKGKKNVEVKFAESEGKVTKSLPNADNLEEWCELFEKYVTRDSLPEWADYHWSPRVDVIEDMALPESVRVVRETSAEIPDRVDRVIENLRRVGAEIPEEVNSNKLRDLKGRVERVVKQVEERRLHYYVHLLGEETDDYEREVEKLRGIFEEQIKELRSRNDLEGTSVEILTKLGEGVSREDRTQYISGLKGSELMALENAIRDSEKIGFGGIAAVTALRRFTVAKRNYENNPNGTTQRELESAINELNTKLEDTENMREMREWTQSIQENVEKNSEILSEIERDMDLIASTESDLKKHANVINECVILLGFENPDESLKSLNEFIEKNNRELSEFKKETIGIDREIDETRKRIEEIRRKKGSGEELRRLEFTLRELEAKREKREILKRRHEELNARRWELEYIRGRRELDRIFEGRRIRVLEELEPGVEAEIRGDIEEKIERSLSMLRGTFRGKRAGTLPERIKLIVLDEEETPIGARIVDGEHRIEVTKDFIRCYKQFKDINREEYDKTLEAVIQHEVGHLFGIKYNMIRDAIEFRGKSEEQIREIGKKLGVDTTSLSIEEIKDEIVIRTAERLHIDTKKYYDEATGRYDIDKIRVDLRDHLWDSQADIQALDNFYDKESYIEFAARLAVGSSLVSSFVSGRFEEATLPTGIQYFRDNFLPVKDEVLWKAAERNIEINKKLREDLSRAIGEGRIRLVETPVITPEEIEKNITELKRRALRVPEEQRETLRTLEEPVS